MQRMQCAEFLEHTRQNTEIWRESAHRNAEASAKTVAFLERARRLLADDRHRGRTGRASGVNRYAEWEADRLQLEADIQKAEGN
jgi:hypothetical protein